MARRRVAEAADDQRDVVRFGALVVGASVVVGGLGRQRSLEKWLHADLPATALMVVVPTAAAAVLSARSGRMRPWMDRMRLTRPSTMGAAIAMLALPACVVVDHALQGRWAFESAPGGTAFVAIASYVAGAVAEEAGWTAFLLPRLLRMTSPMKAALALGLALSAWHVPAWLDLGRSGMWIGGHIVQSTAMRLLIVALTLRSRNWLWPAVAIHATSNIAWAFSSQQAAFYRPLVVGLCELVMVAALYRSLGTGPAGEAASDVIPPARASR